MSDSETLLLERPGQVAAALSPIRRRLLDQLVTPGSATEVAERVGLTRQKVNYHVRALEKAGLLELVEERQRRGCTERVLRTRARRLVVDPQLLESDADTNASGTADRVRDRFTAAYQLAATGKALRDVAVLRQRAHDADQRLALATMEVEVSFDSPAALRAFADAAAECLARLAVEHGAPEGTGGSRPYRVLLAARPAITKDAPSSTATLEGEVP